MTASMTSASMDTDGAPFTGAVRDGTGLGEGHRSGISVTGHARADMLLIKPAGGPGRCRQPGGQVTLKARQRGQISHESRQVTGTEPGSGPGRYRCTTHSQISHDIGMTLNPRLGFGVAVNRPGFRAYFLSWEGCHVHA